MQNIFLKLKSRTFIAIILLILILGGMYYFINAIINPPLYIIVEFSELGPIYKKMPVYYKGYKIGITQKIKPSDDYKTTLVTIKFYPNELKLPNNITAKVKPLSTTRDYIELIYPKKSSGVVLKTGDKITGSTTIDIQSFMNAQYESGAIGFIIESASVALGGITRASNEASVFLHTLNQTVSENRKSLRGISSNLDETTRNMKNLSKKLDNSISQEGLTETTINIKKTAENIENITKNLNGTIKRLDAAICNINGAAENINEITEDVKISASNRKGLFGLLLGTKNPSSKKCANKKY